jgi:hypothetical protein
LYIGIFMDTLQLGPNGRSGAGAVVSISAKAGVPSPLAAGTSATA